MRRTLPLVVKDCTVCPLRPFHVFDPFNPDELDFMLHFRQGEMHFARGEVLLRQGETAPHLFTILQGQATRSILLPDGRRQVVNFAFPGDFVGLQGGITGEMRHTVEAAAPTVACVFDRSKLWDLFRNQPGRAYDLTWIAAMEEHFLGETIATLGQRSATERVAWALVKVWRRLAAVGLCKADTVPMPHRQQDLADALGLSLVHTNRTLMHLRSHNLAHWSGGRLRLPDHPALSEIAGLPVEREERRPLM